MQFFFNLNTKEQNSLLLHEVLHMALLHVTRRSSRDIQTWNIAADIVVNNLILENNSCQAMDGSAIYIMENEKVFSSLKQSVASYLWYLLLTPVNLYTNESQNGFQTETTSTPIGIVIGPGLAGVNMIAASSSNKKFQQDLLNYNMNGVTIKSGENISGLVGIRSDDYNAIKISIE